MYKFKRGLSAAISLAGFGFMVGTEGAVIAESMNTSQVLLQMGIGVLMFSGGLFFCKYIRWMERERKMKRGKRYRRILNCS